MYQKARTGIRYSSIPETIPPSINSVNVPVYLNNVPPHLIALLFRDMGLGDRLLTQEDLDKQRELAKQLTAIADQEFQVMLKRLKP